LNYIISPGNDWSAFWVMRQDLWSCKNRKIGRRKIQKKIFGGPRNFLHRIKKGKSEDTGLEAIKSKSIRLQTMTMTILEARHAEGRPTSKSPTATRTKPKASSEAHKFPTLKNQSLSENRFIQKVEK
jgi:hypothetical protein